MHYRKPAAQILVKFLISNELQTREINLHASLAIFFLASLFQNRMKKNLRCFALRNDEFRGGKLSSSSLDLVGFIWLHFAEKCSQNENEISLTHDRIVYSRPVVCTALFIMGRRSWSGEIQSKGSRVGATDRGRWNPWIINRKNFFSHSGSR